METGRGLFRGVRGGACRRAVLAAEPHAGRGGTGVYRAGRAGAVLVICVRRFLL